MNTLDVRPALRAMLSEAIGGNVPLWGSNGFPYRCGVTEAGFTTWALAPTGAIDETLQWVDAANPTPRALTVGTMMRHFCNDCPVGQRFAAQKAGTCIQRVIRNYHGGGRPPKESPSLDDSGSSSSVRQARAAYSYAAPPEGSDGRRT